MGIIRRALDVRPLTRADNVLSNCDNDDTVFCSRELHEHGLRLGLFLRLHDLQGQAFGGRVAEATWAFRNHRPFPITFVRKLVVDGGALDAAYVDDTSIVLRAGKSGGRFVEGLSSDSAKVVATAADTTVRATVRVTDPSGFVRDGPIEEFGVSFPPSGSEAKCCCCRALFPM
jgi:hypothetical protein